MAHLVLGKIKGGFSVFTTDFKSATLVETGVYEVTDSTRNYLMISDTVNIWVYFTTNGNTPDTTNGDKFYVPAGVLAPFIVTKGTKIAIKNA